jgi:hypothetical protein
LVTLFLNLTYFVILAKAGIHWGFKTLKWIPVFTGMTTVVCSRSPLHYADGAKVAVKQRALGGHALYEYIAGIKEFSASGCLSEASFRLLPLCRVAQGSRRPWCWGAVFFGYFLFRQLKESD